MMHQCSPGEQLSLVHHDDKCHLLATYHPEMVKEGNTEGHKPLQRTPPAPVLTPGPHNMELPTTKRTALCFILSVLVLAILMGSVSTGKFVFSIS